MLPAILGGLATGVGSSLVGGLFGGGGGPTYEPSPLMEDLFKYGKKQIKASKSARQAITAEANSYASPGAKEAFLQSYIGRFSNPEFIERQLERSYKKPIDYSQGGYRELASSAYNQQGLGLSGEDFQRYVNIAKATNVRSPQAFSDFIRQDLIASGRVKTPEDLAWETAYGDMPRDEKGRLIKGLARYDPNKVSSMVDTMIG